MNDVRNRINKDHNFFLQNFSGVRKISNVAESKDSNTFGSRYHWIHISFWIIKIFPYDFTPGFPKP